ncbi:hypothetical protein EXU57_08065 [Segetibacter sp. 3557_3]|uniref:hypothetical protein n=1 Tax=Segetibacter sp. 3557_3 TaxID=2547429 RepID=UPI0010589254|nr:hypothetical protein [Segetibacter sp. 3557_3]TDH26762.1 hypothetical protein EXU57_08065 [Segetibacter sp. 3557_3]
MLLLIGCSNYKNLTLRNINVPSLSGEWRVAAQLVLPLTIKPKCKPIEKGTTFKFIQDRFEVYLDTAWIPCDVFHFKSTKNTISFIKEDMVWLCFYELTGSILKLKSTDFFIVNNPDTSATMQEVVVTLMKKQSKNSFK